MILYQPGHSYTKKIINNRSLPGIDFISNGVYYRYFFDISYGDREFIKIYSYEFSVSLPGRC